MTPAEEARLDATVRRVLRDDLHHSVLRFVPPLPANDVHPPQAPSPAA